MLQSKRTGWLAIVGAAVAAVAPYVNVNAAVSAVTAAHPWAAPVVTIALTILANHVPGVLTDTSSSRAGGGPPVSQFRSGSSRNV